jgi:hypothetical protein
VTTEVTRTPNRMTKRRGRSVGFDSPFISGHSQLRDSRPVTDARGVP